MAETLTNDMLTDLREIRQYFALQSNYAAVLAMSLAIEQRLGLSDEYLKGSVDVLKKVYLNSPRRQCEASIGGGENPPQCPNLATCGRMCAEHYQE